MIAGLIFVLKGIGYLLLAVVVILLIVLLAVLLVPVRYEVYGYCGQERGVRLSVSWFLRAIGAQASYVQGEGLSFSIRLLWKELFSSDEGKKKGAGRKGGRSSVKKKKTPEGEPGPAERKAAEEKELSVSGQKEAETAEKVPAPRELPTQEKEESPEGIKASRKEEPLDDEVCPEKNGQAQEKGKKNSVFSSVMERIRRLCRGLCGVPAKLFEIAGKLREAFERVRSFPAGLFAKAEGILDRVLPKIEWVKEEKNQRMLGLFILQAKKALLHILPREGALKLTFGFDDPATTGQVLMGFSLVYPFLHRQLSLHPVFDEKILEGNGRAGGRVFLGYFLWLAVRILLDGYARRFIFGLVKGKAR